MVKVVVPLNHDPQDLTPYHLAVSRREPTAEDWRPALRDTVGGRRVLWARFPTSPLRGENVWVLHNGEARQATALDA